MICKRVKPYYLKPDGDSQWSGCAKKPLAPPLLSSGEAGGGLRPGCGNEGSFSLGEVPVRADCLEGPGPKRWPVKDGLRHRLRGERTNGSFIKPVSEGLSAVRGRERSCRPTNTQAIALSLLWTHV